MTDSLTERMHWSERLKTLHSVLARQTQVLDALYTVSQHLYSVETEHDRVDRLMKQVAMEIVVTCQAIWDDSCAMRDAERSR